MMACGHAAQAQDDNGTPACVICIGIHPGAMQPVDAPDLTGRKARCDYYGVSNRQWRSHSARCDWNGKCDCERPSDVNLPFFTYRPGQQYDEFYCGCAGWD